MDTASSALGSTDRITVNSTAQNRRQQHATQQNFHRGLRDVLDDEQHSGQKGNQHQYHDEYVGKSDDPPPEDVPPIVSRQKKSDPDEEPHTIDFEV